MIRKKKDKNTEKKTSKREQKKIERNTVNAIPYEKMFRNGICEVNSDIFSMSMKFTDINYQIASEEDQLSIFGKYMELLNSLGSPEGLQLTVQNRILDESEFKKRVLLPYRQDGFDEYRDVMNDVLVSNIQEGNNAVETSRFFTYATKEDNYEDAFKSLKHTASEYSNRLNHLSSRCEMMTGMERLEIIHRCFDPINPLLWNYDSEDSKTTKQAIAPVCFDFSHSDYFIVHTSTGKRYVKSMFLKNYSTELSDKLLSDLSKLEYNLTMSFHMKVFDNADAINLVKGQIAKMEIQKMNEQKNALKAGYDPDMITQELKYSLREGEMLLEDVQQKNQRLFSCQFIIMANCASLDELAEVEKKITSLARKHTTEIAPLNYLQEDGMCAALPLGITYLPFNRTLTTGVCATFIPFSTQELMHTGEALYYGVNAVSHNLILCNRRELMNPSGWILGKPGAGKSFAAKREMVSVMLSSPKNDVIVIDPEREYSIVSKLFNGSVVKLDNKSKVFLNPLDGDIEEDKDFIADKVEFIQAMCAQIIGDKSMNPKLLSIIDRVARRMYDEYRNRMHDKENIVQVKAPTLTDFYNLLKQQNDVEAKDLAVSLELYVEGTNNIFAKDSNINVNTRFTVYDIQELGNSLKPLGMLVTLESLWNRIISNWKKGVRTWIYIDEIYLLLTSKYCREFFKILWKRARKYGAVLTGITQNVEELLEITEIRTMLSNSEFIMMLNQATADREQLMELLNISEEQSSFISNSEEGSGLLFNGKVIVPFKDRFPKGNILYDSMTTKPEERKQLDSIFA